MRRFLGALCTCILVLVAAVGPSAGQSSSDTVFIIGKDNLAPSNSDIALALSNETTFTGNQVILSRDDEFADALASGLLQSDAPLLLVPTSGPIPQGVSDRIASLGAGEAVILGGTAAISDQVEAELLDMGLGTARRAGGSRFDTAVAIAESDAPDSDTLLLARAFPADGSADPSQAFADTLAAGAMSAREGWPVLLTHSDSLTAPTRDYIVRSPATRVLILGGTTAISDAVAGEVEALVPDVQRVAGASRADTAIEIAKVGGAQSAADASHVVLVEGQGENAWAGGFAAASHAASLGAPIVLASGTTLPPETEAFLSPGIGGDPAAGPVITCVVVPDLCETARVTAGLPPMDDTSEPPPGPPAFEPISETFSVELADNQPSVIDFEVGRGFLVSAEVVDVPDGCNPSGVIYDPSRQFSVFAESDGSTYAYWSPFVAASAGGTWEVEMVCTSQTGPVTLQVDLRTRSDADVEAMDLGTTYEVTRGGPADFRAFSIELTEGTSYIARQSIVIGGATARVVIIAPDGSFYTSLDCASGTCDLPLSGVPTGRYQILASSYGDDRLTYELSINEE